MKGPLDRTKVVLRHLPPTISQTNLLEHVDSRFSGRYRWISFRPGKSSLKYLKHSRAYIDFDKAEDVIEFAEFFNGHVFVNEKGTQFKTIVEYAPSQRVPKQSSKKDGREGTILKDPEYLEFLEWLAKPVENLPSAEIQLERKEAERAGASKDVPIVTPLMDYVRQKRAAKGGARRTLLNGKSIRRDGGIPSRSTVSGSSRRGSGKRTPSTMYVLRESPKDVSSKDKSAYMLLPKQDDKQPRDKSVNVTDVPRSGALEGESGGSGSTGIGKKKILLLKGKEKGIPGVSGGSLVQQNAVTSAKNPRLPAPLRQNNRGEPSGRIIRSILLNKDNRQNQPSSGFQSELRTQPSNQDRDAKPPRPSSMQSFQKDTNGSLEDKIVSNDLHAIHAEKHERTRNKDRPERGVWTPLRRSDGSHASDESLSSSTSQTSQIMDSAEDMKHDMLVRRGGEYRPSPGGRGSHYPGNGSYRHGGRRGSAYSIKDAGGPLIVEGKPSKRGGSGTGSNEKQVWVQKSGPGS